MTEQNTQQDMPQVKRYPAHFYASERDMRNPALRNGAPNRLITKGSRQLGVYRNPAVTLQVSR